MRIELLKRIFYSKHTHTHAHTHRSVWCEKEKKSETIESCDSIVDCRVRITLEMGVSQLSYSPTSLAMPPRPHVHVLMALLACVAKFYFLVVVVVVVRKVVCINNLHSYKGEGR